MEKDTKETREKVCEHCEAHHHEAEEETLMPWWRMGLSAALLVAGLLMDYAHVAWFQQEWARLLWYVCAFLPVGLRVMAEAVDAVRQEKDWFSEFMLMSVAAVGAFAIKEFPEAVAVMLLYCVGETLQDKAADHVRENVSSLVAFRPDRARRVEPVAETVKPEQVNVGDVIEVQAGERVPLDGTLLTDSAAFDTSALTGESLPRTIMMGQEVLAGMIATERVSRLRVSRPASQSAVSRILALVEEATERKTPTELFIRRFAHVYTPTVILLAALVVIVPLVASFFLSDFAFSLSEWVHRALVFLVISCPCALVISIPLGYFGGIGAASRRGILFKGSNYLDAVTEIDSVVFDKTGTLTTGQFHVERAEGLASRAWEAVVAVERMSSHPIAKAIVEHWKRNVKPQEHTHEYISVEADNLSSLQQEVTNEAGYGLSAGAWLVGTLRLLARHGVAYPAELKDMVGTLVAVAEYQRFCGYILLSDTLKTDAHAAIAGLRGLHTEILSGDKQQLVTKIASELGVDVGLGDLLPQDKAARLETLRREGRRVAFVGDGINDAPVLALSDVGFAMGALGSDMAVETANIIIQTDQPSKVAEAVRIGRRTRRIVKQNIVMSVGIKVAVMLLGVCGLASLWMAVFADTGVALLAVLNATRVLLPSSRAENPAVAS